MWAPVSIFVSDSNGDSEDSKPSAEVDNENYVLFPSLR